MLIPNKIGKVVYTFPAKYNAKLISKNNLMNSKFQEKWNSTFPEIPEKWNSTFMQNREN